MTLSYRLSAAVRGLGYAKRPTRRALRFRPSPPCFAPRVSAPTSPAFGPDPPCVSAEPTPLFALHFRPNPP